MANKIAHVSSNSNVPGTAQSRPVRVGETLVDSGGVPYAKSGLSGTKLDDLATPDDNTDLDATTARHGLLPKLAGGTVKFLRADGTFAQLAAVADAVAIASVTIDDAYTDDVADWDLIASITITPPRVIDAQISAQWTAYAAAGTAFAFVALLVDDVQVTRVWQKMLVDVPTVMGLVWVVESLSAAEHTFKLVGAKHTAGGSNADWRTESSGAFTFFGM